MSFKSLTMNRAPLVTQRTFTTEQIEASSYFKSMMNAYELGYQLSVQQSK